MSPHAFIPPAGDLPLMLAFLFSVLSGLTLLYLLQQRLGERERRLRARLKALLREGREPVIAIPELPAGLPDLYREERKPLPARRLLLRRRWIVYPAAGLVLFAALTYAAVQGSLLIAILAGAAAVVAGGTVILLRYRRQRSQRQFIDQLPEAIDIIIRGARVGMSLQENFRVIASEMPDPIGREFRIVAEKLAIGIDLETALAAAVEKTGAREMQFMATTLILQRRTGGQYAEVLENLAGVLRERRARHLKAQALTAEARTSARIVAGVTGSILVILALTSREQFDFLLTDPVGNRLLAYAMLSLIAGFYVMSRLLRRLK